MPYGRRLLPWAKQLNMFKSASSRTPIDIQQQRITTRLYLISLAGTILFYHQGWMNVWVHFIFIAYRISLFKKRKVNFCKTSVFKLLIPWARSHKCSLRLNHRSSPIHFAKCANYNNNYKERIALLIHSSPTLVLGHIEMPMRKCDSTVFFIRVIVVLTTSSVHQWFC